MGYGIVQGFNLQFPWEHWNSAWVPAMAKARTTRAHAPVVADSLYLPAVQPELEVLWTFCDKYRKLPVSN